MGPGIQKSAADDLGLRKQESTDLMRGQIEFRAKPGEHIVIDNDDLNLFGNGHENQRCELPGTFASQAHGFEFEQDV